MVVYFGPEVEKALKKYLEVRENITPLAGHEHALFYSTQRRRIGVQAIENLVKKYARDLTKNLFQRDMPVMRKQGRILSVLLCLH